MSNDIAYCGAPKTMGQGSEAIYGNIWWESIYQCDKCKLKDAEALIAKQDEHINIMRHALTEIKNTPSVRHDECS